MKIILALFFISVNISFSQVTFNGDINYLQQDNKELILNNNIKHIYKIYENHKYIVSISNSIGVDLDHFQNEIKETNVFTTIKIEF